MPTKNTANVPRGLQSRDLKQHRGECMRGAVWNLGAASFGRVVVGLLWFCCGMAWAQTRPLNDTGITFCGGATSGNNNPCLVTDPAGQDNNYGRDAAALAGALPAKVGGSGGTNGFDFTKVCNSGQNAGQGACPANPTTPGYGADEWGCSRDNVTGLLWEVKTTGGLRSMNHTYSWYLTNSPDGNNGTSTGGSCDTTGRCDTEKYSADVNAASQALCGQRDWRMPTVKELEGIADFGRTNPVIDPTYFPNTPSWLFWSGTLSAAGGAWPVLFGYEVVSGTLPGRSGRNHVRLVRGGL